MHPCMGVSLAAWLLIPPLYCHRHGAVIIITNCQPCLANNRFLLEQENVLKIFHIREPLVINIPRKPVAACNLGLH